MNRVGSPRYQSLTFIENNLTQEEVDKIISMLYDDTLLQSTDGSQWKIVSVVPSVSIEGELRTEIEVVCVGDSDDTEQISNLKGELRKRLKK